MSKKSDADAESEKPKKRRRGGWARPHLPRFQRSPLKATEQFQNLRAGMSALKHRCPQDGSPMELTQVFPQQIDGEIPPNAEPYPALVCPACSFTVPIELLREQYRQDAEPLKKSEKSLTFFAFGVVLFFGFVSFLNGNLMTLLAAMVIAFTVFLKALFYRYRYWQATNGRMFEEKPPLTDWLRDEFKK